MRIDDLNDNARLLAFRLSRKDVEHRSSRDYACTGPGLCLKFPVTRYGASAEAAHSKIMSPPGPAQNLFIFGVKAPGQAEPQYATERENEHLRGRAEWLQQRRNDDVGVEDNPDHGTGYRRVSRRAWRADAISASISSTDNCPAPVCGAACQDRLSQSGTRLGRKACRPRSTPARSSRRTSEDRYD